MKMKSKLAIALLAVGVFVWLVRFARPRPPSIAPAINYTQFIQQVQAGQVVDVKITAGSLGAEPATVRLKNGETFQTLLPLDYSVALDAMQRAMVNIEIRDASNTPWDFAIHAAPFFILLAFWIFFMTIGRPLLGRLR